jgi:hypothetical protein
MQFFTGAFLLVCAVVFPVFVMVLVRRARKRDRADQNPTLPL